MPTLGEITALVHEWYPPSYADDWDAVGLVCGDPGADVRRVLLAVDPVEAVVDEAVQADAQLLITHHPLLLKGVHGVGADSPKGRVVHRLITHACGLLAAHTNADAPAGGVSESMALALGLQGTKPLEADADELDKVVTFVPRKHAERLRTALAAAGAGRLGDYDSCSFSVDGEGRFRPLEGADPHIGSVGRLETVGETRVEVVVDRARRGAVIEALRAVHPYEEPAFDVVELAPIPSRDRGSGRIGRLDEPTTLADFARRVAERLPATAHGVRVAGDPAARVETVALCGGSGDFLLGRAAGSGADVYVTSDLRHHPASESREAAALALVDVAHWAAEWTWLPVLAGRLRSSLGDSVEVQISTIPTDPWTFRVDQPGAAP